MEVGAQKHMEIGGREKRRREEGVPLPHTIALDILAYREVTPMGPNRSDNFERMGKHTDVSDVTDYYGQVKCENSVKILPLFYNVFLLWETKYNWEELYRIVPMHINSLRIDMYYGQRERMRMFQILPLYRKLRKLIIDRDYNTIMSSISVSELKPLKGMGLHVLKFETVIVENDTDTRRGFFDILESMKYLKKVKFGWKSGTTPPTWDLLPQLYHPNLERISYELRNVGYGIDDDIPSSAPFRLNTPQLQTMIVFATRFWAKSEEYDPAVLVSNILGTRSLKNTGFDYKGVHSKKLTDHFVTIDFTGLDKTLASILSFLLNVPMEKILMNLENPMPRSLRIIIPRWWVLPTSMPFWFPLIHVSKCCIDLGKSALASIPGVTQLAQTATEKLDAFTEYLTQRRFEVPSPRKSLRQELMDNLLDTEEEDDEGEGLTYELIQMLKGLNNDNMLISVNHTPIRTRITIKDGTVYKRSEFDPPDYISSPIPNPQVTNQLTLYRDGSYIHQQQIEHIRMLNLGPEDQDTFFQFFVATAGGKTFPYTYTDPGVAREQGRFELDTLTPGPHQVWQMGTGTPWRSSYLLDLGTATLVLRAHLVAPRNRTWESIRVVLSNHLPHYPPPPRRPERSTRLKMADVMYEEETEAAPGIQEPPARETPVHHDLGLLTLQPHLRELITLRRQKVNVIRTLFTRGYSVQRAVIVRTETPFPEHGPVLLMDEFPLSRERPVVDGFYTTRDTVIPYVRERLCSVSQSRVTETEITERITVQKKVDVSGVHWHRTTLTVHNKRDTQPLRWEHTLTHTFSTVLDGELKQIKGELRDATTYVLDVELIPGRHEITMVEKEPFEKSYLRTEGDVQDLL